MRISAPSRNKEQADGGFTLVELLIVLFMMGLLSAAVVIAMPDPQGAVTAEAKRFAARAKAARDKAILDGRSIAIRIAPEGYGFEQRSGGEWRALPAPYTFYDWAAGTTATMSGGSRFQFDTTGLSEPATLILTRDGEQARVAIDGGGAIRVGA